MKESKKLVDLKFPYQDTWDISKDHLDVELKDLDLSFVNSLERIILSNIPSLAFNVRPITSSQFQIYKNNSPIENEYVSHRIGLIPVHLDPNVFDPNDHTFIITKENDSKDYMLITSEDFQIKKLSDNKFLSDKEVRKIFPPNPLTGEFFPITKIIPWEDKTKEKPMFHAEGKLKIGTALDNASFAQASAVATQFKIDPELYQERFKDFVKESQKEHTRINKLLKDYDPEFEEEVFKKTEDQLRMKFDNLEAERCYYRNEDDDPYWFILKIESIGVNSPLVLFHKGLEIMIKKVLHLKGLLETPQDGQLEVTKGYNGMDMAYCVHVYNENDTLGNLISQHLKKYFILEEDLLLNAGYNRPHPLKNVIHIYLSPKDNKGNDWGMLRSLIYQTCDRIVDTAKNLIDELEKRSEYKGLKTK